MHTEIGWSSHKMKFWRFFFVAKKKKRKKSKIFFLKHYNNHSLQWVNLCHILGEWKQDKAIENGWAIIIFLFRFRVCFSFWYFFFFYRMNEWMNGIKSAYWTRFVTQATLIYVNLDKNFVLNINDLSQTI